MQCKFYLCALDGFQHIKYRHAPVEFAPRNIEIQHLQNSKPHSMLIRSMQSHTNEAPSKKASCRQQTLFLLTLCIHAFENSGCPAINESFTSSSLRVSNTARKSC